MKNKIKLKLRIFFLMLLFGVFFGMTEKSFAADFYITQNASGSDTGADCDNAHSVIWLNTAGNWANPKQDGKIGPGDTAHLCGEFSGAANSTMLTIAGSGSSGSIITILFESGVNMTSPQWAALGAINVGSYDYIKIDGGTNSIIENTDNGSVASGKTYNTSSSGIFADGAANLEICNLTIRNIFTNTGGDGAGATDATGLLTSGIIVTDSTAYSNVSIHDNVINNSRTGIGIGFEGLTVTGVSLYNNQLSDHAWMIAVGAGVNNSNIDVDIYDNEMTDWHLWQYPAASYHTDGLIIFSNAHTNCSYTGKFRGNYVHGNLGGGSPSGFIGTGCGGNNFLIYNNVFVCDNVATGEVAGGCVNVYNAGGCYDSQEDPDAGYQPINTTFLNNVSIGSMTQKNSQGGYSLKAARALTNINGSGGYMTVKNNIFMSWNVALYDPWNADCEGFSGSGAVDHNLYYDLYPYSPPAVIRGGASGTLTLATFCSEKSQDCNSQLANPDFGTSYHLNPDSPAIGAAADLSGVFTTDKVGVSRGAAWDIGAYEYVSASDTTPPSAPSGLSVL